MESHASWIEISTAALKHNISVFKGLLLENHDADEGPGTSALLGAVVKSNAYGHGIVETLPAIHSLVDVLYVTTPSEAILIREQEALAGLESRRLVVLGAISPREAVSLARAGVETVISGGVLSEHLAGLRAADASLPIHVHFDTGLGREGYDPDEIENLASIIQSSGDAFSPTGVCSHFANTEDVTEQTYAKAQLDSFERSAARLEELLGRRLERHIAASAAAMVLPGARCDVVRAGISLYGIWPSPETRISARVVLGRSPELRPVLSWKCRPQICKLIRSGSYVGYGCTWRAPRDTKIAVLPVGYFDGYPRLVSGRAHVLAKGVRCPVVGRVMMNHIVVDITGIPSTDENTTFTLIGSDDGESIPVDLFATWSQTIGYEVVSRLGQHLSRVAID